MKYINEYKEFKDKINENKIFETYEELFVNESIWTKLGNWAIKAPKIKKIMKKSNLLKLEAAQHEVKFRTDIMSRLDKNEYVNIKEMEEIIGRKMNPLIDTAEEYAKDALAIAGDNVYLRKILRVEELRGIKMVNQAKFDIASKEEKWNYKKFDKYADATMKDDMKDINNKSKGKGEYDNPKSNYMNHEEAQTRKKIDELLKLGAEDDLMSYIDSALRSIKKKTLRRTDPDQRLSSTEHVKQAQLVAILMDEFEIGLEDADAIAEILFVLQSKDLQMGKRVFEIMQHLEKIYLTDNFDLLVNSAFNIDTVMTKVNLNFDEALEFNTFLRNKRKTGEKVSMNADKLVASYKSYKTDKEKEEKEEIK
jgi:hypothetical protein